MHMAEILSRQNHDMTFCYISGAGTNSSEKGRMGWARVKGKTENDLMRLPFKKVFAFRPAMIEPTPGQKNVLKMYKTLGFMIPAFKYLMPNYISSLKDLGLAMINSVLRSYEKPVLEVKDIVELARR
jgi:hypothetical protein